MKSSLTSHKADYVGITGSVLCLIHCLITPVLLVTSTLLKDGFVRTSYLSLDYVFIVVNIVAVYAATRHAPPAIRRSLWGFLVVFALCIVLEETSPIFEYAAYVASLGLVGSHLYNIWYCRMRHGH